MLKNMLGIALKRLAGLPPSSLGTVCDFLDKMTNEEWIDATKRFLRKEDPWAKSDPTQHLERIATVTVPVLETFRATAHFLPGQAIHPVSLTFDCSSFPSRFLWCDAVVEEPEGETTLRIDRLVTQTATHRSVFAELGDAYTETTLGQMYEILKAQGRWQEGNLTTDSPGNMFYIRDKYGKIEAVSCHWNPHSRQWLVNSRLICWGECLSENTRIISRCPS
ncbi:MAG: hypothetical protein BWY43_00369 [candidate division WS2 bacterium ADurb.Bin280]|uniref:Uncharacterized protein n=1 Tax=candidate division WS2 bacterium ADurb.Bin280 TaxID=1852829 RepID=A0A1V5SET3_9BACT|nr:MAG: hypothetical protein BWY43_00369 [candidate division WS2 bacterium ADurb.Bin280]